MTWNPNNPAASDKIRAWPNEVTTNNWPMLETMISEDHQFNNTPVPNDNSGYHKIVHYVNQAGDLGDNTPAVAPVANTAMEYTKTIDYFQEGGGVAGTREVPCWQPGNRAAATEEATLAAPIRAAVSFNQLGAILGQAFNVTDVTLPSATTCTVVFDKPMPSTNYLVIATLNQASNSQQLVTVTSKTTTNVTLQTSVASGVGSGHGGLDVIIVGGWF